MGYQQLGNSGKGGSEFCRLLDVPRLLLGLVKEYKEGVELVVENQRCRRSPPPAGILHFNRNVMPKHGLQPMAAGGMQSRGG